MTLGPPRASAAKTAPGSWIALDYEIAGEQASSLGRAGRRVAESLAALAACDGPRAVRDGCLREATDAVWAYFVQRELVGFRRHDDAVRVYAIPPEVLARLGAR